MPAMSPTATGATVRFDQLTDLFERGKYFKLVCGAGNEDAEEVRRLSLIYALAGAKGFDVSATPHIVAACKRGIEQAFALAPRLDIALQVQPYIMVSVGMPGDHHVRKAAINQKCVGCDACIPVCPTTAIPANLVIITDKCIGCGNCEAVCYYDAIDYRHNARNLEELLPKCLAAGAENVELHAAVPDHDAIMEEWKTVIDCTAGHYISMCVDRIHLSNTQLIERVKRAQRLARGRCIIQADGVPMSGGKDDYNTTLQAIATADVIHKHVKDIHLLLSGGTNSVTGKLARDCGVRFAGIAIGTFARKIVSNALQCPALEQDSSELRAAVSAARDLVVQSIGEPVW
jgi:ferredoxin